MHSIKKLITSMAEEYEMFNIRFFSLVDNLDIPSALFAVTLAIAHLN